MQNLRAMCDIAMIVKAASREPQASRRGERAAGLRATTESPYKPAQGTIAGNGQQQRTCMESTDLPSALLFPSFSLPAL